MAASAKGQNAAVGLVTKRVDIGARLAAGIEHGEQTLQSFDRKKRRLFPVALAAHAVADGIKLTRIRRNPRKITAAVHLAAL